MSKTSKITREDSLKERALQILNLRYIIESDIKSSYKRRIWEYHPDRHPEAKSNSNKMLEYENKIKVINQSYELLLDILRGIQINMSKYSLLEDTGLVQSILPENVKPSPLGKTAMELWTENYGDML
ncbi:DnaJ domain-containing protein [Candidatus Bathyarchaeota archaeon]|nr:DnaJ domain-containing protein [Candidatus Bathyarchaeota archaeon]